MFKNIKTPEENQMGLLSRDGEIFQNRSMRSWIMHKSLSKRNNSSTKK